MRLWIVSDLHCDHFPWLPARVPDHDIMVIAGDIGDGAIDALGELTRLRRRSQKPIIFVPGNHDLFDDTLDGFADMSLEAVHMLHAGQPVIIDGVRFVGATLWTDFDLFDSEFASQAWAARHMPEYQRVWKPDGIDTIWPIDTAAAHAAHRLAIVAELSRPHAGPTVVITHHAPSGRSIGSGINESSAAFASDMEAEILRWQPELWVHGHIHSHSDYLIGSTRIFANPRGYQGGLEGEDSGFIEDLVVDV